jgi:hypothetical protein
MRLKVTVSGPNDEGGYDLCLDGEPFADGASAREAARYLRDAWELGGIVVVESPANGGPRTLPLDVTSALQALGAVPRPLHLQLAPFDQPGSPDWPGVFEPQPKPSDPRV